jgi:hypothetical protein
VKGDPRPSQDHQQKEEDGDEARHTRACGN